MREEYINQFRHFWRMFEKIVSDFDAHTWIHSGFALTTPALVAFHILQSTKYYSGDSSPFVYESGRSIATDSGKLETRDLPSKEDIIYMMQSVKSNTEKWLRNIKFEADNNDYKWTGLTRLSVVLFLIRHSQFHLGEINALLNEYKNGKAEDHYANTV
ncbi:MULTISPECIES: DinB family protein [unclassified Oceanispirochaeta]|uniref:DinB family protein n=1 Tax=unclassified Oceanispirochaeta TaxID=2635722 RepID=UPI000E08DB8A|nr:MULTISPECIES: DinB family protein [unclassified Oceanispirochaeta]MBF9017940.1 DinB family protein [Oceanispirochaeta sp. M2]NPD74451.1 DinB family protein [Oceanispirochaeta sp. M1]RDG29660.1 DinB family protein [Oceanispirochaeta sp. M1]